MAKNRLSAVATYVDRGYGQVEPNHLSAQRTGQIYAQLPADSNINVLENGQFVKYDYANGLVNFTGAGEWMLVLNEVKIYRDNMSTCDFAMKKDDYAAYVYSHIDGTNPTYANARNYQGVAKEDEFEPDTTGNPFVVEKFTSPAMMPTGTTMVPRVMKTNIGDIFTTNTINVGDTEPYATLALGDVLAVGDDGYLCPEADKGSNAGTMRWKVAKVYTLADRQKAVKLIRIA